jgi:uncharacterized radical SAM superfamily protein
MSAWRRLAGTIEALDGIELDESLVAELERDELARDPTWSRDVSFHVPSFKAYATSELASCGRSAWPAVSITGRDCKLKCDHCQAKILEPMIAARTPEDLWRVVNDYVGRGARGMLLSGGSNHRNEVEYGPFYPTMRRIRAAFPGFRLALHTALVDDDIAQRMQAAGVDVAMMDVIGSQDTIAQVYHLRRTVADFERSLECLVATTMRIVPHIVVGLHYGRLLGEWQALEIVARHRPHALVLVVAMPIYAPRERPFATPDPVEVGRFFRDARRALPHTPVLLGCARPAGLAKVEIDSYAVLAGLNGIAHPADGMVELAARLGRRVRVSPACCSIALGEDPLGAGDELPSIDPRQLAAGGRGKRRAPGRLARIPIVAV